MKKNIFLLLFCTLLFQGCFSFSSLNPFSDPIESGEKVEIDIPSEAPEWLQEKELEGNILAIGMTKNLKKEQLKLFQQKALMNAGTNSSRKIYVLAFNIFNNYVEKTGAITFEKDLKKFAKEVATSCLKYAKVRGFWEDEEKTLYTQINISTVDIAYEIQLKSKRLFEVNQTLYENILSNRAKENIIKYIEEN